MKLDITKIYIDTRFRTKNSKSETDFNIELPRSFNIPDGVVAHIDDIVLPVSWSTIDERNNKVYVVFSSSPTTTKEVVIELDKQNYDGAQFASTLQDALNASALGYTHAGYLIESTFTCAYDLAENKLTISMITTGERAGFLPFHLEFYTDEYLETEFGITSANTINTIIRNTEKFVITESNPYTCYLDLFQTRNLYLCSSALASYDIVSNFGMDTIIKKIPCSVPYNKLLVQSSGSALDGLDVSKRTIRFIDFKLVDSSFRTIPLQGNHFSFSIVFSQKN